MTREIIVQILEAEGAKMSGNSCVIRDDREATCFISAPGEVLPVARIIKVELRDKSLTLETSRDERFHFAYEDVLGFKLATIGPAKDRAAGFGR